MAYFGLLLDSMKGLEFIPAPPAPDPALIPPPPNPSCPLCTHT